MKKRNGETPSTTNTKIPKNTEREIERDDDHSINPPSHPVVRITVHLISGKVGDLWHGLVHNPLNGFGLFSFLSLSLSLSYTYTRARSHTHAHSLSTFTPHPAHTNRLIHLHTNPLFFSLSLSFTQTHTIPFYIQTLLTHTQLHKHEHTLLH